MCFTNSKLWFRGVWFSLMQPTIFFEDREQHCLWEDQGCFVRIGRNNLTFHCLTEMNLEETEKIRNHPNLSSDVPERGVK